MSGFDLGRVFSTQVTAGSDASQAPDAPIQTENALFEFVQQFRLGNEYIYRDRLRSNLLVKQYVLEVLLEHVFELIKFEAAIRRAARLILYPVVAGAERPEAPSCQVLLRSSANLVAMRDLHAENISHLVRVPGIVISASIPSSRVTKLHLMCRDCRAVRSQEVTSGFGGFILPRRCDAPKVDSSIKCSLDPYVIIHERCEFVDAQTLKLQEAPDMVPVGELPRHMLLSADRALTGRVVPGAHIIATGVFSTYTVQRSTAQPNAVALRTPYLRVLSIEVDTGGAGGRGGPRIFTAEEEDEFGRMAKVPDLYSKFAASVAPSIYGSTDIKKAVTCLLFGGSKKVLPDGMRLRGDINVLLLGDPGTAKSQLLKFAEKVSPIAVYTSGKGSSAAGLTASVQRDPNTGEFFLEAGAMVLADGGIVCIDEFDKMRDEDRVAIHEAMEQQTISIAKAGITTVLNCRTSVLAAANPVWGRYDDMKSPGENIDFQTTILSRFDMIFIVKDEHDESRDRTIAQHVIGIHMNGANANADQDAEGEIDLERMKRYIAYCKSRCAPRLTADAAEKLSSHFVAIRKHVAQVEREQDERSTIAITVRQLEAIIRISEAIAKVTLNPNATEEHVDEAIRLFRFSTMNAVESGNVEGMTRGELQEEVQRLEREIMRRLPLGWTTSYARLRNEFVDKQRYSFVRNLFDDHQHSFERTLYILEKRDAIRFSNQHKSVTRMGV